ncbi:MAG: FG-GAP repeat domain-containing protein, partial [Planctomycetota bacterium]
MQLRRLLDPIVRALLVAVMFPASGCDQGERAPAGESTSARPSAPETAPALDPGAWFVDDAAARGLDFIHQSGHRENLYYIPEMTVGGAALFDMDGDDFLDVYLVQSGSLSGPAEEQPENRLYRNRGDGTFEDVTAGSGAGDRGYGNGATAGDYDGDGDVDLYVTNVGPNALLRNDGKGRFSDVTDQAGVGDDGYSTGAAFVDYDGDGDLDLFVLNYLIWSIETERSCDNDLGEPDYCAPAAYKSPAIDVLYRNDSDGTFT